jgi:hypothetical protein
MNEERTLSTIQDLQAQVRETERELAETKRTVNFLCRRIGRDAVYQDTEPINSLAGTRSDEFYGKPLASAVRTILERRAAASLGAASVDTIYAAMKAGGYLFDAKNDVTAKRSLSTSLAKNTVTFHKLPNGDFGLLEWYDSIPMKARGNGRQEESEEKSEEEASGEKAPAAREEPGLKEPYKNDFAEGAPEAATKEVNAEKPKRQRATPKGTTKATAQEA